MENLTTRERRKRAIEAAVKIAAIYNIKSDEPILLKDSNNTVIHLAPAPLVAKVGTSTLKKQTISNLEFELKIALHLANLSAPIVPPSGEISPIVHHHEDLAITFWQYCPGEEREELDCPELAATINEFHAAFASYTDPLKSFTDEYKDCFSLLDSNRLSAELSLANRQFLRQIYERLSADLETFDYESVPVHTEIHSGNVLWANTKPLLIDFENCALGPRELDFLAFSDKNLAERSNLNKQLMKTLGNLKSFCVAVWCWLQPHRAPEVREAAKYHIDRLWSLT